MSSMFNIDNNPYCDIDIVINPVDPPTSPSPISGNSLDECEGWNETDDVLNELMKKVSQRTLKSILQMFDPPHLSLQDG